MYNYEVCDNGFLIRAAWFQQIDDGNTGTVLDLSSCYSAMPLCDENALENIDSSGTCSSSCDSTKCLDCMGLSSPINTCLRSSKKCYLCQESTQIYDLCTVCDCPPGFSVVPTLTPMFLNTDVCLREPINYSMNKFFYIYVSTTGCTTNDGSPGNPISSLSIAFQQVTRSYTKILISPGDYYYDKQTSGSCLVTDLTNPLMTSVNLHLKQLWISGTDATNRPVIYLTNTQMKIESTAANLYITNVIISGEYALVPTCDNELCMYCPYLVSTGGGNYKLNDRNEIITDTSLYATNCADFAFSFITVPNGSSLTMETVDVVKCQQKFTNFINSLGSVTLKTVNFDRIQSASGNAWIYMNCNSNCESTDFTFTGGSIKNLNYGYEYLPDTVQSGFINANGIGSFYMGNVVVEYAMVVTGVSTTQYKNMFYFQSLSGTITIENCQFSSSFFNYLIYVDASTVSYSSDWVINDNDEIEQYLSTHLKITGSTFSKIGTLFNLIYYKMESVVQNIEISDCTFTDIVANGNGLISILNLGKYSSLDTNGGWSIVTINSVKKLGWVYARSVSLKTLSFTNVFYGGSIIAAKGQPNISITSLTTSNTRDMTYQDYNTIVISAFKAGNAYLSMNLPSISINQNSCSSLLSIQNSASLIVQALSITDSQCSSGYNAIYTYAITTLSFSTILIQDISNSSPNDVLSIQLSTSVSFASLTLKNITTTDSAVLQIFVASSVTISDLQGSSLSSVFRSPVYINIATSITISEFDCDQCHSTLGDGGALYLLTSTSTSTITITDFTCIECQSNQGYGGAIFLNSPAMTITNNMALSNLNMMYCAANDGAAIFISDNVSFISASITSIVVQNSNAYEGAIIYDRHKYGKLTITGFTSKGNTGYYAGINGSYFSKEAVLEMDTVTLDSTNSFISDCLFTSLMPQTSVFLKNFVVSNNGNSPAIKASTITLTVTTLSINSGGGIQISDSATLLGTSLSFSYLTNIAIQAKISSKITCSSCQFQHITSGPALSIENDSTMNVTSSTFYNITSPRSSMALYMNLCGGSNVFYNCTFSKSEADTGPLMDLQTSALAISSCSISENSSPSITAGINLMSSSITITDSTFKSQSGAMGGFLSLSTQSTAVITSTSFFNGTVSGNGGAISLIMSSCTLNSCVFNQNTAGPSGGAIYALTQSNLTINSCTFTNNLASEASAIYFGGTNLVITSSNFYLATTKTTNAIIYLDSPTSFSFINSMISGLDVVGILAVDCGAFSISNSVFSNLRNSVTDMNTNNKLTAVHTYSGSTFSNNAGDSDGGALHLQDVSTLITKSIFLNNSAPNGGGIESDCSIPNCVFNITNTTFQNNSASIQGGAINWTGRKPVETGNTFINNTAPYGGNTASIPALMQLPSRLRGLEDTIGCPPGNACNITITVNLMDSNGNIMTNDFTDTALMSAPASSMIYSVSGNSKATAEYGVFTFVDYIVSGTPGTSVNVSITTSAIDPEEGLSVGDPVAYTDLINHTIYLRNCTLGEQIGETSCTTCLAMTYTVAPSYSCKTCPTGGNCTGGWSIYPKPGYWKTSMYSEAVYECPLYQACWGSLSDEDYIGGCADGYTGHKCFACDIGYSRSGTSKCGKCPSTGQNIAVITALIFLIVFVAVIMVRSTINSAYSVKAMHSIYIKIFTNYLQMVLLTTQFNLQWPSYVLQLFNAQQTVATASDQIFSLDCYFTSNGSSYEEIYYAKLIITVLLPPIIWAISILVWVAICLKRNNWKYLKREMLTTLIILFFLVYPNIVKTIFSMFSCTLIGEDGSWVTSNLLVKCYDSNYNQKSITLGLSGIIAWAIGVPTLVLVLIAKRRKFLASDQNRVVFGFLFNGYKTSRFFWEFVIMYRKILIICILVFFNELSSTIQALTVTLVLFASLFLQYEFKPFSKYRLNYMETEAILTATITIYCGLYYLDTEDIGDEFQGFLFCFIIIGNAYFLIYWLYYMLYAVLDLLSNQIPFFKKLAGKHDEYPDMVNDEVFVVKGVIRNDEEGIMQQTMISRTENKKDFVALKGIYNMPDLYALVRKRILRGVKESTTSEPYKVRTSRKTKLPDDDNTSDVKHRANCDSRLKSVTEDPIDISFFTNSQEGDLPL